MTLYQRCIVFGIGALLGTWILLFLISGKKNSKAALLQDDISLGFKTLERVLPGQDFSARKPLLTTSRMQVQVRPLSAPNYTRRIIVAQNDVGEPIRYEETIWTHPITEAERLVFRQKMYADQLVVRMDPSFLTHAILLELFHDLKPTILDHSTDRIVRVQFDSSDITAVDQIVEQLTKIAGVDAVFPHYISNPL